ncbi:leucyl aminopeptidase [Frigidibacter sp. SD6-1]|uniref:leucyl aminopeptidase n=1 Tax=Frigidibacter sp. SD6-1 TaxID=3032581 RepID=UPI0024DFED2B|nr:leucyl aminopeptidase [Frigidibacter sp. SD6-1]
MSLPVAISFHATDAAEAIAARGRVAVLLAAEGKLSGAAATIDKAAKGAIARAMEGKAWARLKAGDALDLAWPAGLKAEALQLVKLPAKASVAEARKAGAAIGKALGADGATVVAGGHARTADLSLGLALRAYDFNLYKTGEKEAKGAVRILADRPEKVAAEAGPMAAVAEGVLFTRDLVNEPANVLTTTDFAARLAAMQELGLDVEILDEPELEKLGMRALLGVGQGSESPSKVVVMQWKGGKKKEAPFALVGKGVVFDTGGISLKPAEGMQDMTMDMGGAGTVAGVMRALALRKAKCNVVGLVGLVENMPDGRAQRPGDVVKSMKGDTIEVINTDAEGRLVLADVLWYAQERFKPSGMINLATLTGAVIVALGHENAGVFSNDDKLCAALLKAASAEGEGAWRLPLSPAYDALLKSHIADMRNSVGRPAGSITAAQFLKRFVKDETPWCHIDIAGVALPATEQPLVGPKCASGWGVMTLNRLMADLLE